MSLLLFTIKSNTVKGHITDQFITDALYWSCLEKMERDFQISPFKSDSLNEKKTKKNKKSRNCRQEVILITVLLGR